MKELEKLDLDPDEITKVAEKTLNELLKVCEQHNISKEGLIKEMENGIDPEEDTGKVTCAGKEVTDLDLEMIAMRGEHRLELDLSEDQDNVIENLVEHQVYCQ